MYGSTALQFIVEDAGEALYELWPIYLGVLLLIPHSGGSRPPIDCCYEIRPAGKHSQSGPPVFNIQFGTRYLLRSR